MPSTWSDLFLQQDASGNILSEEYRLVDDNSGFIIGRLTRSGGEGNPWEGTVDPNAQPPLVEYYESELPTAAADLASEIGTVAANVPVSWDPNSPLLGAIPDPSAIPVKFKPAQVDVAGGQFATFNAFNANTWQPDGLAVDDFVVGIASVLMRTGSFPLTNEVEDTTGGETVGDPIYAYWDTTIIEFGFTVDNGRPNATEVGQIAGIAGLDDFLIDWDFTVNFPL